MSEVDKTQVGGSHYRTDFWQTWNLIVPMGWDAFQFEIINYVDRFKRKNGLEDLKKARHWLDKLIEVETARLAASFIGNESFGDGRPEVIHQPDGSVYELPADSMIVAANDETKSSVVQGNSCPDCGSTPVRLHGPH